MFTFITILHLILCFFLIVVVLLQTGKGADMGAAFGGASQTVFGATGAMTLLHKVTTVTAVLFMLTSMSLAWNSARAQAGGGGL
ncbi:MAG: preprotein translocase subunit SecG, partial [Myxococcota bacterium]|nr:preprotein translocase subunit SecG [Myxococcota bacterium]